MWTPNRFILDVTDVIRPERELQAVWQWLPETIRTAKECLKVDVRVMRWVDSNVSTDH